MADFNHDPAPAPGADHFDITKTTWVRLGTVISFGVALWIAYSWLDSRFKQLEQASVASSGQIADAIRRIEAATSDQWTRTDQRLFILELALRNRTLNTPVVSESKK